jgi:hypothetical protein
MFGWLRRVTVTCSAKYDLQVVEARRYVAAHNSKAVAEGDAAAQIAPITNIVFMVGCSPCRCSLVAYGGTTSPCNARRSIETSLLPTSSLWEH